MTKKILLLILFISFLFTKLGYCPELPPSRARQIRTSTTNFDGNLGTDDINVQTALETIDDLALGASPWTDGGTELYPTNGEDVAIKGTGPDLTLQVTGGDTFGFHAETDLCFWKNDTDGEFYAEADTNHNLLLRPFTTDGKVGINLGHGTPTYNLQVGGTAYVSGTTTLNDLTVHANSTIDLNSNRATEMGTPVVGTDGANKDYVDDVVE